MVCHLEIFHKYNATSLEFYQTLCKYVYQPIESLSDGPKEIKILPIKRL